MKNILPVPFDIKGQMMSWTEVDEKDPEIQQAIQKGEEIKINPCPHIPERVVTFKPNKRFWAKLKYTGYTRGCSSTKIVFSGENKRFEMFMKDFDDLMIKHGGFEEGRTISGHFEYCKRGQNYGIKMVFADY